MTSDAKTAAIHEWMRTIAILLTPVLVAVIGARIASSSAQRQIDVHLIEIATEILQKEPAKSDRALRGWAVEVIDQYSEVKLTPKLKDLLVDSLRLSIRAEFDSALRADMDSAMRRWMR
jgi:hypothetical protein